MNNIRKARREYFGGIIFSESPGYTAFINNDYADKLKIPKKESYTKDIYSGPLDVHLSVTGKCNLFCKGCYNINPEMTTRDIDFELAQSIVRNMERLGVFTISLGGGEPFLYPHLFELASYIRERNMVPNITTNGLCISGSNSSRCTVFGNIHLSIHTMNDLNRLEKVIKNLQDAGIRPGLNVLLSQELYLNLEYIFMWAKKLKISKMLLLRFKMTRNNSGNEDMQITFYQEKNLFSIIKRCSKKYNIIPLIDCSLFQTIAIHKLSVKELRFYDINGCMGGNMYIAVDVNGNYKPCSFWDKGFGKANELNYNEWISNEQLNAFRGSSRYKICADCSYTDLCNRGCRLLDEVICQKC